MAAGTEGLAVTNHIREEVNVSPQLARPAAVAAGILAKRIGTITYPVNVRWGEARGDGGRPVLELTLTDETGETRRRFDPAEVRDEWPFIRQVNSAWSDFQTRKVEAHLARVRHWLEAENGSGD